MKKILAVVRASTERQEVESQQDELRAFCVNSLGYAESEIEFIAVAGASAVKLNAAYLKMWDDIKTTLINNHINTVAFWDVNRLGRNERMLIEMKNWFVDNRIQVHFKNQGIQLLDDNGNLTLGGSMLFNVLATTVVNDTKEMFAKMHRGKMRNKANKKFNGGRSVKYGYRVDENGYIVINPDEAEKVRMIFEMYSTGNFSFLTLAEELRDRGISLRDIKCDCWFISKILIDDSYCGYSTANDKPFDPIITRELFDLCATVREGKQLRLSTKEHRNVRLGLRLMKCTCGKNYVANDKYYMCYASHSYKQIHVEKCNSPRIHVDVLDNLIWDVVRPVHAKYLLGLNTADVDALQNKADIIVSKITQKGIEQNMLEKRVDELDERYFGGADMSKEKYDKLAATLQAKLNGVVAEIENLNREKSEIEATIAAINTPDNERMAEAYLNIENIEDKKKMREIVLQHVEKIELGEAVIENKKHIIITIFLKNGVSVKFARYGSANKGRKYGEFKPTTLIEIDGDFVAYNAVKPDKSESVIAEREKYLNSLAGLPDLSVETLIEGAIEVTRKKVLREAEIVENPDGTKTMSISL